MNLTEADVILAIRYGVRIPIQASAAGRRKYGKRGKGLAPKGRRPALPKSCQNTSNTSNRYILPIRKEPKGKRPHNLTANICWPAECWQMVMLLCRTDNFY